MKSWRERIAEARERGKFTLEDRLAWASTRTCLVGEQVERYIGWGDIIRAVEFYDAIGDMWSPTQAGIQAAIRDNDVDFVERRLDAIEDRALELKRRA